jgi:hypothetical protein
MPMSLTLDVGRVQYYPLRQGGAAVSTPCTPHTVAGGRRGHDAGQMGQPMSVALDASGSLYVVDGECSTSMPLCVWCTDRYAMLQASTIY